MRAGVRGSGLENPRHRANGPSPAARRPQGGPAPRPAPPAEGELRRRRAPVMMGALGLMPAFGARQRHGLLAKQLVQRRQPVRMDPREQVLARGRHPGEHRLHQVRQRRPRAILRLPSLPSLCSLRHWRLLGPGRGDRLSWSTRFSRRPGSRRYSVLKFNRHRDIPHVWAQSGMRAGEVCGLQWQDVDLEAGTALVQRTWSRHRLGPPKTGRARKVSFLHPVTDDTPDWRPGATSEARSAVTALRRLTIRSMDPEAFVFGRGRTPRSSMELHRAWRRVMAAAKVRYRAPEQLSHKFASTMLSRNAPLLYVQAQGGWRSASVR